MILDGLGLTIRESQLADRVRDVESQNRLLRHQLSASQSRWLMAQQVSPNIFQLTFYKEKTLMILSKYCVVSAKGDLMFHNRALQPLSLQPMKLRKWVAIIPKIILWRITMRTKMKQIRTRRPKLAK